MVEYKSYQVIKHELFIDENEDSEPLLGQALMEALSPYDHTETTPTPPAVPSRVEGTAEIKRGGRKLSSGDSPSLCTRQT
ncbi:hypothetical protein KUTeg_021691 [Tegillarca granosa]|uniref:E3 ubiquitin-protein ligase UBR4 N-terminal domain-containing protein n=1 Tax=Tegillarca granosa TaxID=220873 RepID=A0ABQ9E4H3_TEGGR|nr:hypothetical protein KUTeg_021691 [Tegillarca granosa]